MLFCDYLEQSIMEKDFIQYESFSLIHNIFSLFHEMVNHPNIVSYLLEVKVIQQQFPVPQSLAITSLSNIKAKYVKTTVLSDQYLPTLQTIAKFLDSLLFLVQSLS